MSDVQNFKHYDLSKTKTSKSTFSINNFYGVDYSSAQLNVENNHAVDIQNLIYEKGVGNVKRNGWETILKASAVKYYTYKNGVMSQEFTNTTNINGVYTFFDKNNVEHIIFHIGKCLFEAKNFGKEFSYLDTKLELISKSVVVGSKSYKTVQELLDQKSQAFVGSNRLYILGGNKFYLLSYNNNSFNMEELEDSKETYVPTTTIGITYSWKEKSSEDEPYVVTSVGVRTPLDGINLLTQWRKNKLVSGTYIDSTYSIMTSHFWDYELDTNIQAKNDNDLKNIRVRINSLKENN